MEESEALVACNCSAVVSELSDTYTKIIAEFFVFVKQSWETLRNPHHHSNQRCAVF
jgi:hypothetical protein